jgi:hypothetical protein
MLLQDEDFKRDIVVDNALEPFIINLKECDASKSDTRSSDKDESDLEKNKAIYVYT